MLHFSKREERCEIEGRQFIIREMNGADQAVFYEIVSNIARFQAEWEAHNKAKTQDSEEAQQAKKSLDSENHRLWQMMLHPTDGQDPVTPEWVRLNTNGRIADGVVRCQMELNDFDNQMGKALARTAAANQAAAALSHGPIFAARSVTVGS